MNCIKEIREGVDFTSLRNANFSQISEVSGQSILQIWTKYFSIIQ